MYEYDSHGLALIQQAKILGEKQMLSHLKRVQCPKSKPQSENFRNLLSFRFYVKLILESLEVVKLPYCNFRGSEFC